MRIFSALFLIILSLSASAQKKSAWVSGKIMDENENPVQKASIFILGKSTGTTSNDSGYFRINVPADRAFALVFSFSGFNEIQKNFLLSNGEEEKITIQMQRGSITLETVVVQDERDRKEVSLTRINPKNAILLPSTIGGIEGLIKILANKKD